MARSYQFGVTALLALSLAVTDCSAAASTPASTTPAKQPPNTNAAATVTGAGSTALQAFIVNALGRAQGASKLPVFLPYSGVGSGTGQTEFLAGKVDYGVSDIPFTSEQYATLKKPTLQIPALLNTVSVFINISGVTKLILDPDTLAKIFEGKIKKFSDPAIQKLNPGAKPVTGNNIEVFTRSDASGTTALFTSYLVKAAPKTWTLGSALSVNFTSAVRGVAGTNSVVAALSAVGNSIGYATSGVGLAAGLTEVAVKNFDGNYLTSVQGDYTTLSNKLVLPAPTGDWSTVNLTYVPGNATYPISGLSYYLVRQNQAKATNGALVKQLFAYLESTAVQNNANVSGLRPLPARILKAAKLSVADIEAPATPQYALAFTKPASAKVVTG